MYLAGGEGSDAGRAIARIWHVKLDRLADTPLASDLLRVLAWYAPEQIPCSLVDGICPIRKAVESVSTRSSLCAGRRPRRRTDWRRGAVS
jgi:hypothetical protein